MRLIQLHRGHAQIQHDAVKQRVAVGVEFGKIARDQPQPITLGPSPVRRHVQCQGVTVDTDHTIGTRRQKALGIAPCPKGAIQPQPVDRRDSREQRGQQNRNMGRAVRRSAVWQGCA